MKYMSNMLFFPQCYFWTSIFSPIYLYKEAHFGAERDKINVNDVPGVRDAVITPPLWPFPSCTAPWASAKTCSREQSLASDGCCYAAHQTHRILTCTAFHGKSRRSLLFGLTGWQQNAWLGRNRGAFLLLSYSYQLASSRLAITLASVHQVATAVSRYRSVGFRGNTLH